MNASVKVKSSSLSQVLGELAQNPVKHAAIAPFLQSAMAGLVRRVSPWHIGPPSTSSQHPRDAVEHIAWITPRPPTLGGCAMTLAPRKTASDCFPLLICQVHPRRRRCSPPARWASQGA